MKSIREACRRLALGNPERYEKRVKLGLVLSWLPVSIFIIPMLIPLLEFELIQFPLTFGLTLLPTALLISGYSPIFKLKSHLSGLEKESTFAILAVNVCVNAGLTLLRALKELSKLKVLKHVSLEVERIKRDTILNRNISVNNWLLKPNKLVG